MGKIDLHDWTALYVPQKYFFASLLYFCPLITGTRAYIKAHLSPDLIQIFIRLNYH